MGAVRQDFTIWRGTAPTIEDSIFKADGTPEDLNNWTAVLTLRTYAAAPNPVALTKAMSIYGPSTNGKLRVTLTKAETLSLSAGRYTYTIERSNSGNEDVLTYGTVTVRLDVVNAA